MSDIPGARVVRGGEGGDGGGEGDGGAGRAGLAPLGRVLRLAPRAVPRRLAMRLMLGGVMGWVGWGVVVLGLVLALVFLPMIDLGLEDYDRSGTATITDVEETASTQNKRRIYRVHYTFVDHTATARHGASYTEKPPAEGGTWRVRYSGENPATSRLESMRAKRFSAAVVGALLFPIIGVAFIIGQLVSGRRKVRLLRYGRETGGRLLRKQATNVTVNKQRVMALTFEYAAEGATHTAVVKTTDPRPLEDDVREPMLYDPKRPSRATTLDHLPGAPRITADGEIEARPGPVGHLLILPILAAGLCAVLVAWHVI